jgi:hypothetical protein
VLRQLLDIVNEREQLPLAIDLGLSAKSKAIHSLVVAHVAEHRLHDAEAPSVLSRPSRLSMRWRMRSVCFIRCSFVSMATCRLGVVCGLRRHFALSSQPLHALSGARNLMAL